MSIRTGEEVYRARAELGKLFHIEDSSRVIFTCNATEALNLGIKGVLERGDHVVTSAMEHNSVLRPLKALEKSGVETSVVECAADGTLDSEAVRKAIRANTRLIVCTHVSNVTGTVMPVREIGELAGKRGILFLLDAAQSAGSIPIDVKGMGIDMLAAPGHKGLLGPMGTGLLYVGERVRLKPLKEGGNGTRSKELEPPLEFPEGLEAGTLNAPGIIGLGHAVKYLSELGVESVGNYEEELVAILDGALRNMSGVTVYGPQNSEGKGGICAFNLKRMGCEEVCDKLSSRFGIAARGGFHCAALAHKTIGTWDTGAVRLSVGPFNTKREINKAVDAIHRIQKM
jgi:cysteine desulfurase family protein